MNKNIIKSALFLMLYKQSMQADTMKILNLTSQQATVTLETKIDSYSMQTRPNENLFTQQNGNNQSNQYDNPLSQIDYDHAQIKKITINRGQSDMPQIIYYNDEIPSGNTGIYNTYVSGSGTMKIDQNGITINGLTYNLGDLNSLKIKCNKLKEILLKNLDVNSVQKDVDDLAQSLRTIELSDQASTLGLEIALVKSGVEWLVNKLQIIHEVKNYTNNLDEMKNNLTSNNVDEIQNKLNNVVAKLQTLDQTDSQNIVDPDAIKSTVTALQTDIVAIQNKLQATDHNILVNQ